MQKSSKVKYEYDYPENRAIAARLTMFEKKEIAKRTGYSLSYVIMWSRGMRRSAVIEKAAELMTEVMDFREKKAEEITV